jgi:RNA polymerase sigma-70 factor, ECF subfamily
VKSDEQLVNCYRESGHAEALEELVRRHLGKVRAMIYPMVLDPAITDDLTQEVFLRMLGGLAAFNGRSQFATWLYRVTMNTACSFLARQARSPVTFCATVPDCAQPDGRRPEQAAAGAELDDAVEAALRELSPKLRAAIVLTAIRQLPVGEAAQIEGCTTATMYWRIHRARKLLKQRLNGLLET